MKVPEMSRWHTELNPPELLLEPPETLFKGRYPQ